MKIIIGKNKSLQITEIFYFFIVFITIIICLLYAKNEYQYIWCLPFTFMISYLYVLLPTGRKSLTVKIISFCAFLRYVILPMFQSICPVYSFSGYTVRDDELILEAIGLMCYELVFICIFIKSYFFFNHPKENFMRVALERTKERFSNKNNKMEAILLFSVCVLLYSLMDSRLINQISFWAIDVNTSIRMGVNSNNSTSLDMILRQLFVTAIFSLFLILITILKLKVFGKHPKIAFRFSLLLAMLCTCMIISEQRSSQVYCAFASVILLEQLYPEKRKNIIMIIGTSAGAVLVMLSIYKTFYAFLYSSYAEALASSSAGLEFIVQTLEVYLLGPVTMASALQFTFSGLTTFSLSQLLFDFGRSTIGISFLLKDSDRILTSAAYNQFVTRGLSDSGYLLPITGQGYAFLGFIFAPVLICLLFYFALKIEKVMFNSTSTFIIFFSAYIYIRIATCMISANLNSVLVAVSTVIISSGTIFAIQYALTSMQRRY